MKNDLSAFGIGLEGRSSHNSRTIMLDELQRLLRHVHTPNAAKADYLRAIIDENCLGKKSGSTRKISADHLVNLYALDPAILVFKALWFFWDRDVAGQPLLALICAYGRDYVLNLAAPFVLKTQEGMAISKAPIEDYIAKRADGRFSKATLESSVRNVLASLSKTGHISGRVNKIRSRAKATSGSVSYALLLGYLCGERGQSLFETEYTRLLDCTFETMVELAEDASRSGWIVFKHMDTFFEVRFPQIIKNGGLL
jgi:hypothetical protein